MGAIIFLSLLIKLVLTVKYSLVLCRSCLKENFYNTLTNLQTKINQIGGNYKGKKGYWKTVIYESLNNVKRKDDQNCMYKSDYDL